ncbi:MAG: DEAD/DEAH box helicase family protein [Planctomycetaceae bacterium]|jgi:predicted helicase|nr:DEAD/DEAH box helicase family protein [Planctomycetaceae bacterium]
MTTIYDILRQIRENRQSERDKGTRFEEIVRLYLKHEPEWKSQFQDVVFWSKWEGRNNRPDTGIDLVAVTHDGEYVAVQCKCYAEDTKIQKPDIDSFLAASSKKEFDRRIIVATTELNSNAAEAVKNQNPPVHIIGLADLENSQIDWTIWDETKKVKLKPTKTLRPHQTEAVKNVCEAFKTADRGKLIMACGTGKTFTSLKIAEEQAGKQAEKGGLVLFLVPSLSLMSQTLREWIRESKIPLQCFAVCSDTKVGKHDEDDPATPDDLVIPATTDAQQLVGNGKWDTENKNGKMTVVFSTYQSIDVIHKAQRKGLPEFDLIICDEAHRTTGAQLEGKEESEFVRIHDNKFIKGKKRLYMTATPRLYSAETKAKAKERDVPVWSMDDEEHYGQVLYYLGFSTAVEQGLLSDYKVVILGVDELIVPETFQKSLQQQSGKKELPLVDPAKIIGCWNALAGKFNSDINEENKDGENKKGKNKKRPVLHRAVAFTTSIKQSKTFREQFSGIIDEYFKHLPQESQASLPTLSCEVKHVDGTQNTLVRNEALTWLKDETDKNECRILTNARCLSEGVDVPALDAVIFLTPRKSKVDVVQSVGRVMRKAEGKDYGYIILPIVIPAGEKPEETLNKNETYQVVWDILQALRAHDDRFQTEINVMELDEKWSKNIIVNFIGQSSGESVHKEVLPQDTQELLNLTYDDIKNWKNALYATIIKKCGEKRYWEDWAKDVAEIAKKHIEKLQYLVDTEEHSADFSLFLSHLKGNINDEVDTDSAIEMLAQHKITKPVFDALFGSSVFSQHNPVSKALDRLVNLLEDVDNAMGQFYESVHNPLISNAKLKQTSNDPLEKFYESVRNRVKGVDSAAGKQKIVLELYDKFFKSAFPKMSERLGIVYTPVEVVDFIIHSVDAVLRDNFNKGIGDKDIHVLDPFTGTGTFIVQLLQSGLIDKKDLQRKYRQELHANEIVLLAYYIAAVNIENTFHEINPQSSDYVPFEGIVLTDTFNMVEGQQKEFTETFPVNSTRAKRQQQNKDIRVIIGNPPYSTGQKSANDNNPKTMYPTLDDKIRNTYAATSSAQLLQSLYDSYIRAIRWASDRIGDSGVIGFVSNGSYIDGNAMDGLRKCLSDEFTDIYTFNCRGNQRTSGELSRKEGGKIFGSGSRASIAITIFVKNPKKADKPGTIHYYDIGDYLNREEKLATLRECKSLENVTWQTITPNAKHDWINQRGDVFEQYFGIDEVFEIHSNGLKTNRDAWCYNFSSKKLSANMKRMIDFYNEQVGKWKERKQWDKDITVDDFVDYDIAKISWTHNVKKDLEKGTEHRFQKDSVIESIYRPFCKQHLYFNRRFNERVFQMPRIFPEPGVENLAICVIGRGATKDFCTLITNMLPDLEMISKAQCFPYYVYELADGKKGLLEESEGEYVGERIDKYIRRENITDAALAKFQEHYDNKKIAKEDIFYYIYGILNCREYQERFSAELKKQLPRIPFATDFLGFAEAGRKLAKLHLNYETLEKYPLKEQVTGVVSYHVTEMKFPSKTDKTKIIYNSTLTLEGIPPETFRYIVNGKSALEWMMERYRISTHKDSGITNDPNDWCKETGNERYIVDLVKRIVTLSIESVKIIEAMPAIDSE